MFATNHWHKKFRHSRMLKHTLHLPELWHWNKRTVAAAVLIGLFVAALPIPLQMLVAAAGAILFRANLPVAVSLVWLSNPVTILPLAWFCLTVGCTLLQIDTAIYYNMQFGSVADAIQLSWKPLFLGSLLTGTVLGMTGYYLTLMLWRKKEQSLWNDQEPVSESVNDSYQL